MFPLPSCPNWMLPFAFISWVVGNHHDHIIQYLLSFSAGLPPANPVGHCVFYKLTTYVRLWHGIKDVHLLVIFGLSGLVQ